MFFFVFLCQIGCLMDKLRKIREATEEKLRTEYTNNALLPDVVWLRGQQRRVMKLLTFLIFTNEQKHFFFISFILQLKWNEIFSSEIYSGIIRQTLFQSLKNT